MDPRSSRRKRGRSSSRSSRYAATSTGDSLLGFGPEAKTRSWRRLRPLLPRLRQRDRRLLAPRRKKGGGDGLTINSFDVARCCPRQDRAHDPSLAGPARSSKNVAVNSPSRGLAGWLLCFGRKLADKTAPYHLDRKDHMINTAAAETFAQSIFMLIA